MADSGLIELHFDPPLRGRQPLPHGGLTAAVVGVLAVAFALLAPMGPAVRVVMFALAVAALVSAAGMLLLAVPSRSGVLRLMVTDDSTAVVANPIQRRLDFGGTAVLFAAAPVAAWAGWVSESQPMDIVIGPLVLLIIGGVALSTTQARGNQEARTLHVVDSGIGHGAQFVHWDDFDRAEPGKRSSHIVLAGPGTSAGNQTRLDVAELASDRLLVIRLINFYRNNPAERAALSAGTLSEAIRSGQAVSATPRD